MRIFILHGGILFEHAELYVSAIKMSRIVRNAADCLFKGNANVVSDLPRQRRIALE